MAKDPTAEEYVDAVLAELERDLHRRSHRTTVIIAVVALAGLVLVVVGLSQHLAVSVAGYLIALGAVYHLVKRLRSGDVAPGITSKLRAWKSRLGQSTAS
jgi:hypothetical protein